MRMGTCSAPIMAGRSNPMASVPASLRLNRTSKQRRRDHVVLVFRYIQTTPSLPYRPSKATLPTTYLSYSWELDLKQLSPVYVCVPQSLPTRVLQGMVWIWPDTTEEGLAQARVKSPATIPELDDPNYVRGAWVVRDLEV